MTKSEMRLCRREWITYYLRVGCHFESIIKMLVRSHEIEMYGRELKAYAQPTR